MSTQDIRSRKLGFLERLRVLGGRCPACEGRLKEEIFPEFAASWSYAMPKYVARTLGNRGVPKAHVTQAPKAKHCPECGRWYAGKWEYDLPEEVPAS